jgi:osmoprotectant transport system permease protein
MSILAATAATVALKTNPSSPSQTWKYFIDHRSTTLSWLWSHTWLAALPVVLGLIISLPLGYLARRYRWIYPPVVTLAGVLYTIPSIALFVVMPSLLGTKTLDPINVAAALTIYTVALLVRVVADGLAAVPAEVNQAATAMGYRRLQRLFKVELPIAVPVIAAGLRVAAVSNVSMVAVASAIGVPELGQLFITGFQLSTPDAYYPPIILGLVGCILLATVFDVIIVLLNRMLTPWRRAVAR